MMKLKVTPKVSKEAKVGNYFVRTRNGVLGSLLIAGTTLIGVAHAGHPTRELPCNAASHDNNIFVNGLGHNSFDEMYRSPFGAVSFDHEPITLRFRTCLNDAESVRVRLWDSVEKKEIWIDMFRDVTSPDRDPDLGPVQYWRAEIPLPKQPDLLYYFFEIRDGSATQYYVRNIPVYSAGGWGRTTPTWDDVNTFQISVYDPSFHIPDWFKGRVIYQILPDRFRNGDKSNDPATGSGFIFGKKNIFNAWNQPICDPRSNECPLQNDNQFYGGDLKGITDKIDYIQSLGTGVIYMNPIFLSATNHRYDTQDYTLIDTKLGTMADFTHLVNEAHSRDVKVILDGVYNHGSADSPYFDIFHRWNSNVQTPGGHGACEDLQSPFRSWFTFPHVINRPIDHYRPGVSFYCEGPDGTLITYESWWGYYEHPVYNKKSPDVLNYFYAGGPESIARRWIRAGADGWRLDVAGDIAPGAGIDPKQNYWQEFRKAIHLDNPEAIMIGEEWANASSWLLGREWDSTTNYRFRTVLLNWLSDGCVGKGCTADVFEDDDNNWQSAAGPFRSTSETEFEALLRTIFENYPEETWNSLMNPLGSHDTLRALFVLKKVSKDDLALAKRKLKLAAFFQFTFPGSPVILYGDEAGVDAEGAFYEGRWKKDPYSRVVYPWADEGLQPDTQMIQHFAKMGNIRKGSAVLQRGSYKPVLMDNSHRIFAFKRILGAEQAWVVLNRKDQAQTVQVPVQAADFPDGTVMKDLMTGKTTTIQDRMLNTGLIDPLWGQIWVNVQR